ncbi:hypothetical protein [Burkholderia pseudomallei]|uniref:hypothetical protein n=1 Tax=Burkholderia pseudomallei TaxID=28450 RepID=UPI000F09218C|nr:hypothetical protein [Burkholderia pseudomallei]CAJ3077182.1 Uncharacterised protein [Burkholderia pseudomallei]VCK72478.1 Uncharacterised protein [Burkholderia pseudomallei]VCK79842.1 Uncharacterised protein [Burkholderia pseudomallei]VCK80160.1 Uncharacterised protein [Burkholderia pseudomallei]VCK80650.1 Uncharacterised protein [Burkholderia pseudomallei]
MSNHFEAAHLRETQWRAVAALCAEINGQRASDHATAIATHCHDYWADTPDHGRALIGFTIRRNTKGGMAASVCPESTIARIRVARFDADLERVRADFLQLGRASEVADAPMRIAEIELS